MAIVTANGKDVIDGSIYMPRVGDWHASLRVDSADALTGAVTISIEDGRLQLVGTVSRGGTSVDTAHVRIVGGAGGLGKIAKAKHYTSASVRVVLSDLLASAGERLSPTADAATLARQVPAWTTMGLPVGRLISRLLASAAPGTAWRVLPDGSIWVGTETWPAAGADGVVLLDEAPDRAEMLLGVDAPLLLPGTTLDMAPLTDVAETRRISYVEFRIAEPGPRIVLWFERSDVQAPSDRLKDAFEAIVRGAVGNIDYHALYWAKVVKQSGATIDVQPEDARVKPMAGVPLLTGSPGEGVTMPGGGRVLVGWSGGDPARPCALAFDGSTRATKLVFDVLQALFLGGEAGAQPTIMGTTYRAAQKTLNTTLAATFQTMAGNCTGPLAGLAAGFTALSTAVNLFEAQAAGFLTTKANVL